MSSRSPRKPKLELYTLWLEGCTSSLTHVEQLEMVLDTVSSVADTTRFQIDQLISIAQTKGRNSVAIKDGPKEYITAVATILQSAGIECRVHPTEK